eukprot:2128856-Ditylum_brightwellii.AAC.1
MDITNSYKVALLEDYKHWVKKHINENVFEIQCRDVVEIHAEVEKYTESLIGILSASKMGFLREGIASKAIPQLQLLIKDHKEPEANGEYPTRLVIPATNFTATFLKVGYIAIQKVLDRNRVDYNGFIIVQSSDLKEKLEKLGLTKDKVTMMSLDIKNMYPLVRVKLIKKALEFYS